MELCTGQCLRRTFYAVLVGVSPIALCLLFIAIARLILYRLELAYNRRLKPLDRRLSFETSQSGRLVLSYTPVPNAELQRIIQGEYKSQFYPEAQRRTPRFIKSILPRREPALRPSSILSNLVIRRDAVDTCSETGILTPITPPLEPTFSIVNENDPRRPSVITITCESVETKTLTGRESSRSSLSTIDVSQTEPKPAESSLPPSKTLTTTTVVVEEVVEFHSVSSVPRALALLNSIKEHHSSSSSDDENNKED